MNQTVKLFYSFDKNEKNQDVVYFSTDRKLLVETMEPYISPLIVQSSSIKSKIETDLYESVKESYSDNKVFEAVNISSIEDLKTWILIMSHHFVCDEEWYIFLNKNNLIDDWVSGNLSYTIGHYYYETSKDFGPRKRYGERDIRLNNLWDFKNYFNGKHITQYGEYSHYWYEDILRIVKIKKDASIYSVNSAWLESLNSKDNVKEIAIDYIKIESKTI